MGHNKGTWGQEALDATVVWPGEDYRRQVACLREAIGESLYLVEACIGEVNASVFMQDTPLELLDIVDFARPDPLRRLYPHILILGDGRGLNLGRVARISRERAFAPPPQAVLYTEPYLLDCLLYRPRGLSLTQIQEISRAHWAAVRGFAPPSRQSLYGDA